ncbi:SpoIIE family protein phosphatase [Leptospira sp. 96542]|nr:SpoIIE family protein phosphatase [Leptospira sp. 96542]
MNRFRFGLVLCLLLGCAPATNTGSPIIQKGEANVQSQFESEEFVLPLSGEWLYFPDHIIFPNDFPTVKESRDQKYFVVPGVWTKPFSLWGFLAGDGYATFHLTVVHGLKDEPLSLFIPEMETAYTLFIDGKKVSQNGVVATDYRVGKPQYKPQIVDFIPKSDETNILLQISNFHHRKGGPGQIIQLGRTSVIHHNFENQILRDMLLCGSIFFMGIYHLFLYFHRKKDSYTYWFAITCLLVALRVFITGNKYMVHLVPNLPWELHLKLSYLSFFLIPPIFGKYMFLLFRKYFSKSVFDILFYTSIAFSFLVFITRSSFYTYLMIPYQIFTICALLYAVYVLIRANKDSLPGSRIFLFSFVLFFFSVANDMLVNNLVYHGSLLVQYGIFTMFFFQAVFIARSFSKGFVDAENFAKELSKNNKDLQSIQSQLTNLNEKLEVRVSEKTTELQSKLNQIGKDLKLAKTIIGNLIKSPDLSPYLKLDVLYKPYAEVGGDIYFIKRIQDFYYRIFLADATGHGLQAALYTMMIHSEFERVSEVAMRPNDLLFYMNQHFYDKNADLQIYFPAVVVDFDFNQYSLRYSGAGVQTQVIHKKNGETVYLENTGPIIGILEHYRFGIYESKLEPGDRIFLFTDGIFEELNETDGSAALDELFSYFEKTKTLEFEEIIPYLKTELFSRMEKNHWKDDATILVLEVCG